MKYYNYPDPRGTEVAEDVDSKNISNFAPGGGGVVYFHAVITSGDTPSVEFEESYSDILAAIKGNNIVQVVFVVDGETSQYNIASLAFFNEVDGHALIGFQSPLELYVRENRTLVHRWEIGLMDGTASCAECETSLKNYGEVNN